MSSRQTGLRSLSITAARMPSSRSPSPAAREVKRYSRPAPSRRRGRGGRRAPARACRPSTAATAGAACCRTPWPQSLVSSRAARAARSAASKASSIASRSAASGASGGGAVEAGDRRRRRRSRSEPAASSGQRGLGHEVVGEAGEDRVARRPCGGRSAPRYSPSRPGARARRWLAPTSGMRPIMHSGMATWVRLADDAVAAVAGDADAAAHDVALHQRDVRAWGSGRCGRSSGTRRPRSARPWSKSPRRPER